MEKTVSIPKEEYEKLKKKATQWDKLIDTENLTSEELHLIKDAENTKSLSEKEAKENYEKTLEKPLNT